VGGAGRQTGRQGGGVRERGQEDGEFCKTRHGSHRMDAVCGV